MFNLDIFINNFSLKSIDLKGINLEIDLLVKNNFFIDIELHDINVSLFKDSIVSNNQTGEAKLHEKYILSANKNHNLKLDLKIYYSGIIVNAIPFLIKQVFLCVLEIDVYFKILFYRGHKKIIENKTISMF